MGVLGCASVEAGEGRLEEGKISEVFKGIRLVSGAQVSRAGAGKRELEQCLEQRRHTYQSMLYFTIRLPFRQSFQL